MSMAVDGRFHVFPMPAACAEIAERVDHELVRFVHSERDAAVEQEAGLAVVFDELLRVIGSGGKRLRPVFCCLGYMAAGGRVETEIVRAAAALELLHTFAIVHDDVMDRSPARRGGPASWVHLADEHRRLGFLGDPAGYGVSVAVLAGDLALVLADRAFFASGFPPKQVLPAFQRYGRMRVEVVSGQFLDVLAAHRGLTEEREARRIAILKSGGYTVEGPVHIGALLGNGPPELLERLSAYGEPLGEAFQIRDDVLGVFGDPEETGKDRDSDLREGKRTVLLAKTIAAAGQKDRRFLETRVGRPDLAGEEIERMRKIIEETGALADTLELVTELARRAKTALDTDFLPLQVKALLTEMVDLVATRRR